jgi:methylase of polypeptide subunit release factors
LNNHGGPPEEFPALQYQKHLNGGGASFGQDYIPFLRDLGMPKPHRAFEWCAGPGFIGFSMLEHHLCETLCLADINPAAVAACRRTIARNDLADRVDVYLSDNLKGIPATERWDLVVANPPHFDERTDDLRTNDHGWNIHHGFFSTVASFLKPGAIIILQENNAGSTAETFRSMIEQSGLSIVFVHGCAPQRTPDYRFYYIGIMRTGDQVPAWAKMA